MITKTFDCINLKNELQEKLYSDLKPENSGDYFEKLKKSINESNWINDMKKKSNNNA